MQKIDFNADFIDNVQLTKKGLFFKERRYAMSDRMSAFIDKVLVAGQVLAACFVVAMLAWAGQVAGWYTLSFPTITMPYDMVVASVGGVLCVLWARHIYYHLAWEQKQQLHQGLKYVVAVVAKFAAILVVCAVLGQFGVSLGRRIDTFVGLLGVWCVHVILRDYELTLWHRVEKGE